MIVVLYGRTADTWVTPIIDDLQALAAAKHRELTAVSIETAVRSARQWESVERVYVLPFDLPATLPDELSSATPRLLAELFPRAEVINPAPSHELCWDKLATARRLVDRGVPMPETLITDDPAEARDFVRHHQQAILKEPRGCGGHGHVVLLAGDGGALAGEVAGGRRYAIELEPSGVGRRLHQGVLAIPPPFYLQRLVTDVGRGGVLRQAQLLRAYLLDGQIAFWTERTRDKIRRPSDFIVSVTFGARYRFVHAVSEALEGLARRTAEVLGVRVGVVDLVRAGDEGPFVLEADTDGQHMLIDRSYKQLPEYRSTFDFDRLIMDALLAPAAETPRPRRMHEAAPRPQGGVRVRPTPGTARPSVGKGRPSFGKGRPSYGKGRPGGGSGTGRPGAGGKRRTPSGKPGPRR